MLSTKRANIKTQNHKRVVYTKRQITVPNIRHVLIHLYNATCYDSVKPLLANQITQ